MGSAFHQLCPKYSGALTPTTPTAIRLWGTFTLCTNGLPIETGRWADFDPHLRKCMLCNSNAIEDEFHYI